VTERFTFEDRDLATINFYRSGFDFSGKISAVPSQISIIGQRFKSDLSDLKKSHFFVRYRALCARWMKFALTAPKGISSKLDSRVAFLCLPHGVVRKKPIKPRQICEMSNICPWCWTRQYSTTTWYNLMKLRRRKELKNHHIVLTDRRYEHFDSLANVLSERRSEEDKWMKLAKPRSHSAISRFCCYYLRKEGTTTVQVEVRRMFISDDSAAVNDAIKVSKMPTEDLCEMFGAQYFRAFCTPLRSSSGSLAFFAGVFGKYPRNILKGSREQLQEYLKLHHRLRLTRRTGDL